MKCVYMIKCLINDIFKIILKINILISNSLVVYFTDVKFL
ncbi:hypothetical protein KsCSTR_37280 [Candidatus Kuenenia stuttgartiensis]|uniref:Uncharacterized protein n=1 Tax=Kuenenia stuttgartiensis TaxID=174633 RepID=A0A6G7GV65_KUEST|nr:hypothetical protein KsCSTR_37280 [Candidatus Kuenenia stuttgartiensis]